MLSENVVNITLCKRLRLLKGILCHSLKPVSRPNKGRCQVSNNFGLRAAPGQHSVSEMTFGSAKWFTSYLALSHRHVWILRKEPQILSGFSLGSCQHLEVSYTAANLCVLLPDKHSHSLWLTLTHMHSCLKHLCPAKHSF